MAIKDKLDLKGAWRLWSIRLAAIAGVLWTGFSFVLMYAPDTLIGVLNSLPPEMRAAFPPATGLVLAGVAAGARLWKQGHPDKKDG